MVIQSTANGMPVDRSNPEMKKPVCDFKGCQKSLKLVDQALKCRCEGMFCKKHRDVIAHHCKKQTPLSAAARKSKHIFEKATQEGSAF